MQLDSLYHLLATYPQAVTPSLKGLRPQFQIHSFDTVASTNQTLWDMAEQGACSGTVVLAQRQTAGQGQRGRRWVSAPGGIYASMLLELDWDSTLAPLLTFTSSWGIATLLNRWRLPVAIKWPNDLVVQAADGSGQLFKLGGILTESRTSGRRLHQAVVGVGLNYANVGSDQALEGKGIPNQTFPAIDLQTLVESHRLGDNPGHADWSIELAIATVLTGIWQGLCWQQQTGTTKLMQSYGQLLAHLGQTINVDGEMAQIIGVTDAGQLKLRLQPLTSIRSDNSGNQKSNESNSSPPSPVDNPHQQLHPSNLLELSPEKVSLGYNVAGLNYTV